MNIAQLLGSIEIGLFYGIIAIAVFLTFRIIDFPDLTVDGSCTLGAAVSAAMIVSGYNPYLATLVAFLAGMVAGSVTGYLNVRWNILGLLAGILTMLALYSVNLRIMGRPNISLNGESTIFSSFDFSNDKLIILAGCAIIVTLILTRLMASKFGLSIRATGANPRVSRAYGVRVGLLTVFTLALSNGVVAMAGALFAQSQDFADIGIGTGIIVYGLASVIVGETIIRTRRIGLALMGCILGAIFYRIAIAFALNSNDIGLKASDVNLITSLLVAVTMIVPKIKQSFALKHQGRRA